MVPAGKSPKPNRCGRCKILVGPDHIEQVFVGGVCLSCWEEKLRGVPDIQDEEEGT